MPEGADLVVPFTGEVVNLEDEASCTQALVAIRQFEQQIREAKSALTQAIAERARILGTQTLHLPNGQKAEVRGGPTISYDAEQIETELRALGMPEERIREIVVEEVSYKVSAREAKRAAAANEEYAAVIESAKTVEEKPIYISISRVHR